MPDAYNAPGLSEAPSVPWALNAGREEVRPRGACSARVCGGPWGGARRRACPCGADQGARHCRVTVLGQGACRAGPSEVHGHPRAGQQGRRQEGPLRGPDAAVVKLTLVLPGRARARFWVRGSCRTPVPLVACPPLEWPPHPRDPGHGLLGVQPSWLPVCLPQCCPRAPEPRPLRPHRLPLLCLPPPPSAIPLTS